MNMKKIFRYILLSALTITAVASCEDDRNNFLPEDSFGFNNKANENIVTIPLYGGTYSLDIVKSGKGLNEGSVSVAVIDTLLTAFNTANETSFVALPADKELYSFSTESISFTTEDVTLPVEITWDVDKVSEYMSQNPDKEFCIPVSITSNDLEVNEGRDFFVLNIMKSTLTARQTELSSAAVWESEPSKKDLKINAQLDMAIDAFDFTIEFVQDKSLVETYNKANETDYEFAPDGLLTMGENPVMKAGEDEAVFTMTLNTAVLVDPATGLIKRDWSGYVVPVKIKNLSKPGINVDNDVTYVVLKGMKPQRQLFKRVWGHYSDGALGLPWFVNNGLNITGLSSETFGANDRSFTINDEHIFITSSSVTPGIHKLDLMTGEYLGTLNVKNWMSKPCYTTDPTTNEQISVYPTYATSCPRMIPNNDPAVNGGEDILAVCGLADGSGYTLRMHAYLAGADGRATMIYDLAAARRFGDRMSFSGTWQDGKFWFRSNQDGDALVGYIPVKNGEVQNWIKGYRITVADYKCFSEVYWTPQSNGDIQDYCLIGTNSEKGLHLMTGCATVATPGDVDISAAVELACYPELACTYGWNFFEYNGIKLMAFVSVKDKAHPMVQVIKGDYTTAEGLKAALDAYGEETIVFSAPLQDQYDATVAGFDKGVQQGDCCVREINGQLYLVAGGCGVGLSMFTIDTDYELK